jgi:hypothetical protein
LRFDLHKEPHEARSRVFVDAAESAGVEEKNLLQTPWMRGQRRS